MHTKLISAYRDTYSVPDARSSTASVGALLIAICCAGIIIGHETAENPLAASLFVAVFLGVVVLILVGRSWFTAIVVASLPWLVTLNTLIPKLTLTFTAALSALLLLSLTKRYTLKGILWLGPPLFLLIILFAAIKSETEEQLIEAAKYSIFPLMALVVASPTNREWLISKRLVFIYSGVTAMAAQGVIILLHIGSTGTKYGVGEQLGFATQNPHELALVGATLAIACLITIRDTRWRLATAAIALTPALATGVRSGVVSIAVSLLVLAIRTRLRLSIVISAIVLCAIIIFSGVGTIIVKRYERDQAKGEFSSISTAGSGRGGLWTTILSSWSDSGTARIFVGDGFRSVERIEEQHLFKRVFIAQSDFIGVLAELGIIGLIAWLLTWLTIISAKVNWILLLPLGIYALLDGSLEYVGATVFCIALAGACTSLSSLRQDADEITSDRPSMSPMQRAEPAPT